MSLSLGTTKNIYENSEMFKFCLGSQIVSEKAFLGNFVHDFMSLCATYQFSLNFFDYDKKSLVKLGNFLLPFGSFINHSCDPNCFWMLVENKIVFLITKPVTAGEKIFFSYM